MINKEFYMVIVEGGSPPKCRHQTQELAEKEAKRLSKETGRTIFVLKAVSCYSVPEPVYSKCVPF